MKLQIEAEGMEMTSSIKAQVEKKLGDEIDKYLKDFEEDVKTADVRVDYLPHKERFVATFNIALPRKEHLYAKAEDQSMDKALTQLREEMEHQIKRYRAKMDRSKRTK